MLATSLHVDLDVTPYLNLPLWNNQVPPIRRILLRNETETDVENLTLRVTCVPPAFAPFEHRQVSIAAGKQYAVPIDGISVDYELLRALREGAPAIVTLTVDGAGEEPVRTTTPIRLLPTDHWGGGLAVPELLAAHVFPNDPAVAPLLRRASELLAVGEERLQLDGYQSGVPRRAGAQALALWTAIAEANIHYVNPPSSFEVRGQKIRSPQAIMAEGLATCLDLAALGAAVLEQAGLHPILVVLREHAYLACWLQESPLSTGIIEDPQVLRKALRNGLLLPCETTCLVGTGAGVSTATERGREHIVSSADFQFAVDLAAARSGERIRPFVLATDGPLARLTNTEAEQRQQPLDLSLLDGITDALLREESAEEVLTGTRRIEQWKNRLLDLSRRNKLLNWRPTGGAMPLLHVDAALLEDQLAAGKSLRFEAIDGRRAAGGPAGRQLTEGHYAPAIGRALEQGKILLEVPPGELQSNLLKLERRSRSSLEEGGANTLFVALGFVVKPRPGQQSRFQPLAKDERAEYIAPLILLPVELRRKRAGKAFTLRARDEDALLNPTLLELLKQEAGVDFPQFGEELPTDDSGLDIPGIHRYVRQRLLNVPGWELVDGVALGEFSFAKYLMWRDLDAFEEHLRSNPIVRHLIDTPRQPYRNGEADDPPAFPQQQHLDERFPANEMLTPMSADSSQLVAVRAASQGTDFVLEGPPGTGKSQTITNIIAQCLGEGKTVLFVSEKTAALEVVHRRLQSIGLGEASLELHSNKISKSYVYAQLRAALAGGGAAGEKPDYEERADRLTQLRNSLNRQVAALHAVRPLGLSAFEAIAYAAARSGLEVPLPDHAVAFDPERRADHEQRIRRLSALLRDVAPPAREALDLLTGPVPSEAFHAACTTLVEQATELQQQAVRWAQLSMHSTEPVEQEAYAALLQLAQLLLAAEGQDYTGRATLVESASDRREATATFATVAKLTEVFNSLEGTYRPGVRKLPAGELAAAWRQYDQRWFLPRYFGLKKIGKQVAGAAAVPPTDTGADLARLDEIQQYLHRLPATMQDTFELSQGGLARLHTEGEWVRRLIDLSSSGTAERLGLTAAHLRDKLRILSAEGEQARELLAAARQFRAALSTARQALTVWREYLGQSADLPDPVDKFATARHAAGEQLKHTRDWRPFGLYAAERGAARREGLAYFVNDPRSGLSLGAEPAVERYRTGVCRLVAKRAIEEDTALMHFSGTHFQELIAEFQQLDEQFMEVSTQEVRYRIASRAKAAHRLEYRSALGILNQELTKKRRQLPVRQLIKTLGGLLPELTPCFMMSPLSIAQYLPPDASIRFDVVVFDEASQIPVWDAIGAIARGRQTIVVGDSKQLPPTSFFDKQSEESDYLEEQVETMESILDEMKAAQVRSWRLRWHYRSRAESLIAFSNRTYYNGDLNTFPAPLEQDRAVTWHKVESRAYEKGRNVPEARALVDYLVGRLEQTDPTTLTFGVVTFNQAQQTLIEDLLESARVAQPAIEPHFSNKLEEPVFVKNIESVQGDERDVILFSITYGPNEAGQVYQRFGPMNQTGGERRLNVAVTRARREMQVFSSLEPEQIDLKRLGDNAQGARDLRVFLSYAKQGVAAFAEQIQSVGGEGAYDSPFERAVAERLRARGYETDPQVGVSGYRIDLGVRDPQHPGRYLAGIECDGATYHRTATARERDILRQSVLEGLGWTILRVWSLDWWHDAERTADKVIHRLKKLEEAPTGPEVVTVTPPIDIERAPADNSATMPPARRPTYRRTTSDDLNQLRQRAERLARGEFEDAIYLEATQSITGEMIVLIVTQEAPLLLSELIRRVAVEGYGYSRTGSRINAIVEKISQAHVSVEQLHGDTVVWPAGHTAATAAGRLQFRQGSVDGSDHRGIAQVPLVELRMLAKELIPRGLDDQALIREMGSVIGVSSVRGSSRKRVAKAIELAWKL